MRKATVFCTVAESAVGGHALPHHADSVPSKISAKKKAARGM
jgi:hypothetical protein